MVIGPDPTQKRWSYVQHFIILLSHRAANVRRFGMIQSSIFVYMLDSDLSEPAMLRGGRHAPPNRALNLMYVLAR